MLKLVLPCPSSPHLARLGLLEDGYSKLYAHLKMFDAIYKGWDIS